MYLPRLLLLATILPALALRAQPVTRSFVAPGETVTSLGVAGRVAGFTTRYGDETCVWMLDDRANAQPRKQCLKLENASSIRIAPDLSVTLWGSQVTGDIERPASIGIATSLIRLAPDGKVLWSRAYSAELPMVAGGMTLTSDGGVVAVGHVHHTAFAMRTGPDGAIRWAHYYDPSGEEQLNAVVATGRSGFVAVGVSDTRPWVMALRDDGSVAWSLFFQHPGQIESVAMSGDDIVLAGIGLFDRLDGLWTARISAAGQLRYHLAAPPARGAQRTGVVEMNGGAAIWGLYRTRNQTELHVAVLDANGTSLWTRQFTLPGEQQSVLIAGSSQSELLLAHDAPNTVRVHRITAAGDAPACVTASASPIKLGRLTGVRPAQIPVARAPFIQRKIAMPARTASVTATNTCVAAAAPPAKPEAPQSRVAAQASRLVAVKAEFRDRLLAMFARRDFTALEELARSLAQSRESFDDGYLKLTAFYQTLRHADRSEEGQLAALDDWRRAYPASIPATILTALSHASMGWEARGSGFSNSVTAEGAAKYRRHMQLATAVLQSNPKAVADPHYYMARVPTIAGDCDELLRLTASDGFLRSGVMDTYEEAAHYLLPRWCGSWDDFRTFLETAAARSRGISGDAIYADLAAYAFSQETGDDYRNLKLDWNRIKKGFRDLLALHPGDYLSYHRFAELARFMDDRQAAADLFRRPELEWTLLASDIWSEELHGAAREWALTRPAESFMTGESKPATTPATALRGSETSMTARGSDKWPPILLQNEFVMKDGTVINGFNSFLLNTAQGVVAVSALTKLDEVSGPDPQHFMNRYAIALDRVREKMKSWTMTSPSAPASPLVVSSIAAMNGREETRRERHVVANVTSTATQLAVHPLNPSRTSPKTGDRAFLLGCRAAGSTQCVQKAYPGTVTDAGEWQYAYVKLDEEVDLTSFFGSPLLNENGEVFGVVTAFRQPTPGFPVEGSVAVATQIARTLQQAGLQRP